MADYVENLLVGATKINMMRAWHTWRSSLKITVKYDERWFRPISYYYSYEQKLPYVRHKMCTRYSYASYRISVTLYYSTYSRWVHVYEHLMKLRRNTLLRAIFAAGFLHTDQGYYYNSINTTVYTAACGLHMTAHTSCSYVGGPMRLSLSLSLSMRMERSWQYLSRYTVLIALGAWYHALRGGAPQQNYTEISMYDNMTHHTSTRTGCLALFYWYVYVTPHRDITRSSQRYIYIAGTQQSTVVL